MKKDITRFINEVKRIMVKYQIRDLRDIKLKGYMIWYNFDKLIFKLNKEGGLNRKGETLSQITLREQIVS